MFFRHQKPKPPSFEERLQALRDFKFQTGSMPDGRTKVSRGRCAAMIQDAGNGLTRVEKAGLLMGNEIGWLVDGGFQKFWRTPKGRSMPALADQLQELHEFEEDLREALGLKSLYNLSLGTINDFHLYDRVQDRDRGLRPPRPWEAGVRTY